MGILLILPRAPPPRPPPAARCGRASVREEEMRETLIKPCENWHLGVARGCAVHFWAIWGVPGRARKGRGGARGTPAPEGSNSKKSVRIRMHLAPEQ